MNKHLAQSSGKQAVLITTRRRGTPGLSREEVSRCIDIWARVYGLREEERHGSDLPIRPWLGRKLTRFD
jgi:hypothetical protein